MQWLANNARLLSNEPILMGCLSRQDVQELVSWSLTSLFSTNMAIWETRGVQEKRPLNGCCC